VFLENETKLKENVDNMKSTQQLLMKEEKIEKKVTYVSSYPCCHGGILVVYHGRLGHRNIVGSIPRYSIRC
jgi:hypothetical protein